MSHLRAEQISAVVVLGSCCAVVFAIRKWRMWIGKEGGRVVSMGHWYYVGNGYSGVPPVSAPVFVVKVGASGACTGYTSTTSPNRPKAATVRHEAVQHRISSAVGGWLVLVLSVCSMGSLSERNLVLFVRLARTIRRSTHELLISLSLT